MEFPLAFGIQKTGLPLILTSGKLSNICFLIDTGASHNVLFDYVYEHFKDEIILLGEKQKIMGIEGKYKETFLIEATLGFEGKDYTSTFSILEANDAVTKVYEETGLQIHGILGIPFLMDNGWILDFKNLTVYCYGE